MRSLWKITRTRHSDETGVVLGFNAGVGWQHVDTNDERYAATGPQYKTKMEALADHEDYLVRAGWRTNHA